MAGLNAKSSNHKQRSDSLFLSHDALFLKMTVKIMQMNEPRNAVKLYSEPFQALLRELLRFPILSRGNVNFCNRCSAPDVDGWVTAVIKSGAKLSIKINKQAINSETQLAG